MTQIMFAVPLLGYRVAFNFDLDFDFVFNSCCYDTPSKGPLQRFFKAIY